MRNTNLVDRISLCGFQLSETMEMVTTTTGFFNTTSLRGMMVSNTGSSFLATLVFYFFLFYQTLVFSICVFFIMACKSNHQLIYITMPDIICELEIMCEPSL